MVYGESNGHVADAVTLHERTRLWPQYAKSVENSWSCYL